MTTADQRVDPAYAEHRHRLQEERVFRLEQLSELQAQTPVSPRHESLARLLGASARIALAEVEAALARIDEGSYGLCTSCGERLSAERLAVLPSAALCMGCHYNEQNCRLVDSWKVRRG